MKERISLDREEMKKMLDATAASPKTFKAELDRSHLKRKNLEVKLEKQENEIAQMKKRMKTGFCVKGSPETSPMVFSVTIVPLITI